MYACVCCVCTCVVFDLHCLVFDLHCVVVDVVCACVCTCVCVCVCVCACVCVCLGWCVCIHNCLASCCAPLQCSIPPGLEGGEIFCYADTINGNCRPTTNLKMWPPVCVRTSSLYAHASSGCESRRLLLDHLIAIATGNCRLCGQPSRKRR